MAIPGGGTVKEYKAPSNKTSVTSERQQTREKYFDNRKDVSSDRLDRRLMQAQELEKFKQTQMKPVAGASNLYQSVTPGGPTTADEAMRLSKKYGPTLSEIGSDVRYGLSNIARGFADRLQAGQVGLMSIIPNLINKFNKSYDKMNDVAKHVFENKGKYSYAENMPSVREAEDSSMQLLEAQKRLDNLNRYKDRILFQDYRSKFMDPAMEAETQPVVPKYQTESIVPEYQRSFEVTESEPTRDVKVLPPEDQTVLSPFPSYENIVEQAQGNTATNKTESEVGFFDLLNPFDDVPIQMGINEMLNPDAVNLEEWKKQNQQSSSIIPEAGAAEMGTQVTAYNNPGNLMFANQAGAVQGQTYGPGYAVFPTAEAGLDALRADLTAKVNRSNKVEDIIGQFAPRSDNPESFDNYLSFVKNRVGDTVEPNEIDELTRSVIQFENKPEVANKYLNVLGGTSTLLADASQSDINKISKERQFKKMSPEQIYEMRDVFGISPDITLDEIQRIQEGTLTEPTGVYAVADGGMIDKQLKSLQNGLQNMYNGIPSVRRR